MMYSTVFMYGLDGRLSPLSYNRVCRVGNLLEYLASSPWVYPNAIFVVSPEGLGSVTGISVSTCGDPCIVLHWSQRFPRICAPFRPLETTKTAPARPLAAEFPHRFQLRGNNCCFLILLSFFFRIQGSILSSVSGIYRWLWCNVFKNMAGSSNLYQHHESEEGTVLHFVAPVL